jgi:fatty acid desaturase
VNKQREPAELEQAPRTATATTAAAAAAAAAASCCCWWLLLAAAGCCCWWLVVVVVVVVLLLLLPLLPTIASYLEQAPRAPQDDWLMPRMQEHEH